jgi:hypothetical protein
LLPTESSIQLDVSFLPNNGKGEAGREKSLFSSCPLKKQKEAEKRPLKYQVAMKFSSIFIMELPKGHVTGQPIRAVIAIQKAYVNFCIRKSVRKVEPIDCTFSSAQTRKGYMHVELLRKIPPIEIYILYQCQLTISGEF